MIIRKIFILSFTAIITLAAGSAFGAYSGGIGPADDPYQITAKADLLALGANTTDYNAPYYYTINNGTITITGYTGSGGVVTIPNTINGLPVTSIGSNAFYECYSLTNVTIPNSVTSIGIYAFEYCSSLTNVTIPYSVTSIGFGTFFGCYGLTSVTIPYSVTSIGSQAFSGCSKLMAITVDSGNSVYSGVDGVLFNKSQTTLIQYPGGKAGGYTIPNSVISIGDDAFRLCYSLTSVTIPSNVRSIGYYAFNYCNGLTNVTIPASVTSIGSQAFCSCSNLMTITVDAGNSAYSSADEVLFNKNQTTLIQYPGGNAGSYTIPNSVTSIGDYAFYYCDNLTNVTIPNSVRSIGYQAFYSCGSLTNITIPNSVTSIGSQAFSNCYRLTAITVDTSNSAYSSVDGVLFNKSQTTLIQCPGGKAGIYTVPASVTSLGDWAFSYCYSLTEVYFQGNAPSLGWDVFYGDNNATIYYLPGTTGWTNPWGGRPAMLMPDGPIGAPPTSNYFNGNQSEKSGATNDPVNTATGNFLHEETDLTIQTRTSPLEFKRFYNNQDMRTTSLGQGWTHSYYILLAQDAASNNINVRWGDGHTDYWQYDSNTASYRAATAGLYDKLIENTDGTWKIIKKNLDIYTFDNLGRLSTIIDKNGNTTSLAYNYSDPNCVTTVTDPAGRNLTLQYLDGKLTSISDFTSRSVTFSYTNARLTQVTDALGHPITYAYNTNGYLKTVTDQRGIVDVDNIYDSQARVIQQRDGRNYLSTFAYDSPTAGQTTITDPNGKTTVHTHFSGYKLLQSIQDALGKTITYTYDANANRTSITDRNGHATAFTYDARSNVIATLDPNDPNNLSSAGGITAVEYKDANFPDFPTKKIDALGNITIWNYDSHGNAKEQIDPNGNHRYWTYNNFGQKLTETDENGNTSVLTYDTAGKLTQKTDPTGNNTWFGYDSLWRLTDITDGRGSSAGDISHTTHTVYDNADRVISITDPNTSESYQYDNVGHKTQITNGRGYKTTYYYDENGNLTKSEKDAPHRKKQTIQYTYDNLNCKLTFSDPNANLTTYTYDAVGHLLTSTNAAGNQTKYTYDAQGNTLSVTDGNGVKISYKYDWLNRKVEQYDLLGNHWYWQYDKLGRVIKNTDARGAKTLYGYDVLGRLVSVIDDCNKITTYQYDKVGNLTQVIDAGGIISTKKFYDKSNKLIRQEDGNGNAYQYGYDGAGNRISVIDAKNQTTAYIYDNHNRLIKINYPDSTQATYAYDRNSNLISTTGVTGTTIYAYDELDRLISSTDCFGKQVQCGYDIVGNRISITYPADSNNPARTVSYGYDKANRLRNITDWSNHTWSYTVDGAGRLTQLVNPNGVKENRAYDNAGQLAGLTYNKSDNTALISFSYTRDGQGNPTKINETGTLSPNVQLPTKTSYDYDTDNRLTDTDQPASYNYDNNGNLISRTVSGTVTNFSYDVENRLISQNTGSSSIQHIYDSRGNRIARVQNGITTRYVLDYGRDMSQVLCETDGTGRITAYYIHGPQIVGRIGTDGSIRYYHSDHIGNIVALTDGSQSISDKYAYTPFGSPAGKQGSTANPFTCVGGLGVMTDADGLYFMRARFYDPETGRFLSKDPVEGRLMEPLGLHRYNYAMHNPTNNLDPSGLIDWGQIGWGTVHMAAGVIGVGGGVAMAFATAPTGIGPVIGGAGIVFSISTFTKGARELAAGIYDDKSEQTSLFQDADVALYKIHSEIDGHAPDTRTIEEIRNRTGKEETIVGGVFMGYGVATASSAWSLALQIPKAIGLIPGVSKLVTATDVYENVPYLHETNIAYYSNHSKGIGMCGGGAR